MRMEFGKCDQEYFLSWYRVKLNVYLFFSLWTYCVITMICFLFIRSQRGGQFSINLTMKKNLVPLFSKNWVSQQLQLNILTRHMDILLPSPPGTSFSPAKHLLSPRIKQLYTQSLNLKGNNIQWQVLLENASKEN